MNNEKNQYSKDNRTEEDRNFYDKYSVTGESEWSRGSTVPFDSDEVLTERHYNLGSSANGRDSSQFSREIRRGTHAGKGPKGYHRSDERIHDDASDALYRCYEVDATEIEVDVKEGIVSLKGSVESRLSKKIAEMTIENLPGVLDVLNELSIVRRTHHGLIRNETGLS